MSPKTPAPILVYCVLLGSICCLCLAQQYSYGRANSVLRRRHQAALSCGEGLIECANTTCSHASTCRRCVPAAWQCDGQADCGDQSSIYGAALTAADSSDEQHCTTINCKPNHFRCAGGEHLCVPPYQVCDGLPHCADGSDEADCGSRERLCPPGLLPCDSGRCVLASWRCDGITQCADGTDETSCEQSRCGADLFRCHSGQCVNSDWRCDGAQDCADASDEMNCNLSDYSSSDQPCQHGQVKCSDSTQCISATWRCDGVEDCVDGSDELKCGSSHGHCVDGWFTCRSSGVCLKQERRCDGVRDCPENGEDEMNCRVGTNLPITRPHHECGPGQFNCNGHFESNGSVPHCISLHLRCDGRNHCNTDEINCTSDYQCPAPLITCRSGARRCAPSGTRCDGVHDCDDGSDEENCADSYTRVKPGLDDEKSCGKSAYTCNNGQCISNLWVCDGDNDCLDHSDEAPVMCQQRLCPNATADGDNEYDTGLPQFGCDEGRCIPLDWLCDGERDCSDGSDEHSCGRAVLQTRSAVENKFATVADGGNSSCLPEQFPCKQGRCLDSVWVCNGVDDCGDNSDEEVAMCARRGCSDQQFRCQDAGNCIPMDWLCDDGVDCDDGSDEKDCHYKDNVDAFEAESVRRQQEPLNLGLRSSLSSECSDKEFMCISDELCVSRLWVCDGNADCSDGSDEVDCHSQTCFSEEYRCSSGRCIPRSWLCDKSADCDDESDEKQCPYLSGPSPLTRSGLAVTESGGAQTDSNYQTAPSCLSPDFVSNVRRRLQRAFVATYLEEPKVALRQMVNLLVSLPPPDEPQFLNPEIRDLPSFQDAF